MSILHKDLETDLLVHFKPDRTAAPFGTKWASVRDIERTGLFDVAPLCNFQSNYHPVATVRSHALAM
jgi:hypothetical protein